LNFSRTVLEGHQCDQHQDCHRRHQDGELEREAFPLHVHEDRDDEAGLEEHEQQDQPPAQVAVIEEVRRVREPAQ
jgi:hypothetical protein